MKQFIVYTSTAQGTKPYKNVQSAQGPWSCTLKHEQGSTGNGCTSKYRSRKYRYLVKKIAMDTVSGLIDHDKYQQAWVRLRGTGKHMVYIMRPFPATWIGTLIALQA